MIPSNTPAEEHARRWRISLRRTGLESRIQTHVCERRTFHPVDGREMSKEQIVYEPGPSGPLMGVQLL